MKKSVLFSLTVLFTTLLMAQIPNGNFETWANKGSHEDPSEWVSTNGLTLLRNPVSVFKSTDAHLGTYACEISLVKMTIKFQAFLFPIIPAAFL
jgi:hypothetical protein